MKWTTILAAALLAANELRGAVLAIPVFIALWRSGGTIMAVWLAFCLLGGIALSVIVPWWLVRSRGAKRAGQVTMKKVRASL